MAAQIIQMVATRRAMMDAAPFADEIHRLVSRYALGLIYRQPQQAMAKMKDEMLRAMAREYMPAADRIGRKAAAPILSALPGKAQPRLRARALTALTQYRQRNMDVFRAVLERDLGTLGGELEAAFAKAAREGISRKALVSDLATSAKAEAARLEVVQREIQDSGQALKDAEAKLAKGGRNLKDKREAVKQARKDHAKAKAKIGTAKSFAARFETKVQAAARDTIRRECERAQFSEFEAAGFDSYTWVAVNGGDACPSCEARHGETGTADEWQTKGMPGDGSTFCGGACMCALVPESYAARSGLERPISIPGARAVA